MTPTLMLTIPDTPRPQERPRFVHGRVIATVSKPLKLWRRFVQRAAFVAMTAHGWRAGDPPFMSGALRLEVVFTFEAPASHPERIGQPHTHKPDADNLAKALLDALQAAKLFKDDAQVSDCHPVKLWGERSSTVVVIGPADAAEFAYSPKPAAPAWMTAGE